MATIDNYTVNIQVKGDQDLKNSATNVDNLGKKINDLNGKPFNVNSTPQVREMFKPSKDSGRWISDNGIELESTDSGGPCIDSEALRRMENDPRAELIL